MAIVQGKDFRLKIYNEASEVPEVIYHATSCEVEFSTEFEEIVTKDTDGGIETTPSQSTWSVSGESLHVDDAVPGTEHNFKTLFQAWHGKQKVNIEMVLGGDYDGAFKITGQAYIESLSESAPADAMATVSYSLKCLGMPVMADIEGGGEGG